MTMPDDERMGIVEALVSWYARGETASSTELPAALADDFIFDDRGLVDDRECFLLGASTFAGFSDLVVLERLSCGASSAAVLFEATDIVTGLRIRTAWFVRFEGREVVTMRATSSQV